MTELKKSAPCTSCGSGSGCQCGGGGCQCGGSGCSKCGDSCDGGPLQRPLFFSGQLLTEDDLQLLSDYAAAKGRLHNRYLHGAGVVCGLLVVCHPCGGGKVIVQPGAALDCCGNEIHVPCPVELDINKMVRALQIEKRGGHDCGDPCDKDCADSPNDERCLERKGKKYCLYIRYCEDLEEPVTPYVSNGDCGTQVCQPTRLREGYRFELRCPEPDPIPDDVIRRIRCCIGDLTRADKAAEDALAVDAYGRNYARAASLISANRIVSFEQADREQLVSNLDTLTPLRAQKIGRRRVAADSDTQEVPDEPAVRRMLDRYQSMAAAVARYDLQSAEAKKALSDSMPGIEKDVETARSIVQETGPALAELATAKISSARDRVMAETWLAEAKKWTDANLSPDQIGQKAHLQFAYNVPTSLKLNRQFNRDLSQMRDWLLDRLDGKVLASDCRLRRDVLAVSLPDAETDDGAILSDAARRLVELLFRYLIDCICAALNPPCQPCEDSAVKLACLTVENCEVTRICNLERTFVLSGPAMRYWLPFLHTIGELFEKFCCETVVRFPRRDPEPQPQPEPQQPVILRAQDQMRRTTPAYSRIEGTPQLQALYRLANLDAETVKTAVNLGGGLAGLAALGGNFSAVPFDFDLPALNKRIDDAAVGFMDRSQIKESMLRDVRSELATMKEEVTAAGAGNVENLVNRQMTARLNEARGLIEKRLSDADEATSKLRTMLADQQKRNEALERRLAKLEKGG